MDGSFKRISDEDKVTVLKALSKAELKNATSALKLCKAIPARREMEAALTSAFNAIPVINLSCVIFIFFRRIKLQQVWKGLLNKK
jgi:hypothetical protein